MTSAACFRVNSPNVIHETLDDEVIIVDLDSGSYYGLDKVGARIWDRLAAGASVSHVAADVVTRHDGDEELMTGAVVAFVDQLAGENLIVPVAASAPASLNGTAPGAAPVPKRPFEAPTLHKYTDMQELLVLDPVHEVDETGWPKARLEPQPEG